MHEPQTVQRFIELRAQGWTYARLLVELNVSKPTLIAWSRKHQFEIQNHQCRRRNFTGAQTIPGEETVKFW